MAVADELKSLIGRLRQQQQPQQQHAHYLSAHTSSMSAHTKPVSEGTQLHGNAFLTPDLGCSK